MEALLRHAHGVRAPDGEIAREGQGLLLQGLPAALGLDLARGDIAPTGPYFTPSPEHVLRWQKAFANVPRPLIGVTFDEFPPGALIGMLAPIVEAVATPVSLVVGPARHQLRNWPKAIDGGVHFDDPADMIAAISCLDAVVGTDCLPLHLAGALGIPGVAFAPCGYPWYFAAEADRSIWYPSLRIIRQAAPGQWAGVPERAAEALAHIVPTNKGAAIQ
jgi:hypothetical protein